MVSDHQEVVLRECDESKDRAKNMLSQLHGLRGQVHGMTVQREDVRNRQAAATTVVTFSIRRTCSSPIQLYLLRTRTRFPVIPLIASYLVSNSGRKHCTNLVRRMLFPVFFPDSRELQNEASKCSGFEMASCA